MPVKMIDCEARNYVISVSYKLLIRDTLSGYTLEIECILILRLHEGNCEFFLFLLISES